MHIICHSEKFELNLDKLIEANQVFTAGYTLMISVAFLVLVFAMMALYEHRVMRFALAACLCAFAFYKRDFIKWLLKSKKAD